MGSEFKKELENLSEKGFDISKVFQNSTETFEKYFQDGFSEESSWFNPNTFPDLRLENLDNFIEKLKSSLKLTSPCVEEANEMVSHLNNLNTKVDSIKDKMKNISITKDFSHLCDLEKRINDNYTKLKCVEKLKNHLNPTIFGHFRMDMGEGEYKEFIKIIQSAEDLKKSREFCYSLKKLEDLSESPSLLEALKKIDENFEKISEMCYLWLTQRTKKILVISSTLTSDSGIINEPLINVSEKDDRIGIASIFEVKMTTSRSTHERERGVQVDGNQLSSSHTNDRRHLETDINNKNHLETKSARHPQKNEVDVRHSHSLDSDENHDLELDVEASSSLENDMENADLSLRMLKILILNTKCLEMFLNDINDFLSELSYRRFCLLLQYIKMDLKNKNNAIYDLFMNLQLVLTLIKSCVVSLYHNCELNLYANPYTDIEIMSAPMYIDKIAANLVSPLENKLDQILSVDGFGDEINESMHSEADFFAIRSQNSSVNSMDDNVAPPEKVQDIQVGDILDLYAAVQICNFYYNKMLNILKPPYLYPTSHGDIEGDDIEDRLGDMYYVVENSPILQSFNNMCEKWNSLIINKLQQNITIPLSDEQISKSLNADMVVTTVAKFLSEIVSIQLEYSTSDDLLAILQMTLNPVINWCQKLSKNMGTKSYFFLIASFSALLNAIQSPFVNNSFKFLLEDLMDNNVELLSHIIIDTVLIGLGGKLVEVSPVNVEFTVDEFLEKMKRLVYTNSLLRHLPSDLSEGFATLDTTSSRLVHRRVYGFMASVYKKHSADTQAADEFVALASSYE